MHIMSWQGKDMWPQTQSFQLLTAIWMCRALHYGLLSPGRVTTFPSLPHPLHPGQAQVTALGACPRPASSQAAPRGHGPMHCITVRFPIPTDCPLPHVLRTHPAEHKHYKQQHHSSASHVTLGAVGKATCFLFCLPPLSPITVPPLSTQLPSSSCL